MDEIVAVASRAAAAILAASGSGLRQREKADRSPVTSADEASEAAILEGLGRVLPGVPIVSEESATGAAPAAPAFLLVDPLDGTRELIGGFDEYAINIALIEAGEPIAGLIAAPALGTVWTGVAAQGAERLRLDPGDVPSQARERVAIRTRTRPPRGAVAMMSRHHPEPAVDAWLDRIPSVERVVCGASLKFCRIAEGTADLYVRTNSISEWDVAAGQAIVAAAGGEVTTHDGEPLRYGNAGLRLPPFIVSGDRTAKTPR